MSDTENDTTTATDDTVDAAAEMHGCPITDSRGQVVLHPTREQYVDVVKVLADEGYAMCADLTAVDYLDYMHRPLPTGISPDGSRSSSTCSISPIVGASA